MSCRTHVASGLVRESVKKIGYLGNVHSRVSYVLQNQWSALINYQNIAKKSWQKANAIVSMSKISVHYPAELVCRK